MVAQAAAPPAIVAPDNFSFVLLPAFVAIWIARVRRLPALREPDARDRARPASTRSAALFNALLAGSLLLLVVGQVLKRIADWAVYSPAEALFFLSAAIVLVPSLRGVVRTWILPAVIQPRRALIVGAGPVGRLVERKIEAHPEYGLDLVGFVDDEDRAALGRTEDLTNLVDDLEIDWVLLASERQLATRRRSIACAPCAGPTCTSRSSRTTSSCSRRTRRSRTSRACRS